MASALHRTRKALLYSMWSKFMALKAHAFAAHPQKEEGLRT